MKMTTLLKMRPSVNDTKTATLLNVIYGVHYSTLLCMIFPMTKVSNCCRARFFSGQRLCGGWWRDERGKKYPYKVINLTSLGSVSTALPGGFSCCGPSGRVHVKRLKFFPRRNFVDENCRSRSDYGHVSMGK